MYDETKEHIDTLKTLSEDQRTAVVELVLRPLFEAIEQKPASGALYIDNQDLLRKLSSQLAAYDLSMI